MKEMTSVATTMMTEEEKVEVEKQMNAGNPNNTPAGLTSDPHVEPEPKPMASTNGASGSGENPPVDGSDALSAEHPRIDKKRPKLTPEQKMKLEEMEQQRKKAMEDRVETLTKQLIERLRPFVYAKHPGDRNDPETLAFEDKMRREAEDMKLESFGVEVRFHTNPFENPLTSVSFTAPAYDWISVYDEGHLIPKVKEVPRNVSRAISPSGPIIKLLSPARDSFLV